MPLSDFDMEGYLPPGLHAKAYPTIKRILVWGSFATAKPEPNDLDYSIIVSVEHPRASIAAEHRRFFVPFDARQFYGVDKGYLVIKDYPLDEYVERLDFLCHNRDRNPCGIIEINVWGESTEQR